MTPGLVTSVTVNFSRGTGCPRVTRLLPRDACVEAASAANPTSLNIKKEEGLNIANSGKELNGTLPCNFMIFTRNDHLTVFPLSYLNQTIYHSRWHPLIRFTSLNLRSVASSLVHLVDEVHG